MGIAEVIWPPMTPEACVPSASACGALKRLGDLCLVHFSIRMKLQCHKSAASALRSNCPKDTWGPSASMGLVAFWEVKACFCRGKKRGWLCESSPVRQNVQAVF